MEEDIELLDGVVLGGGDDDQDTDNGVTKDKKDKKSRDLVRLQARVGLALKNINQGASALEVNDQVIATDLHELIYRLISCCINSIDLG